MADQKWVEGGDNPVVGKADLDDDGLLVEDQLPDRLSAAQLSATFAQPTVDTNFTAGVSERGQRLVQVREAPLTPYRYGAVNPIAGSDNTTALAALFAAAVGTTYTGAEIYLPPGLWRYAGATPLALTQGMKIRGAGRNKTRVASITGAGNLFEWNTNLAGVQIEDLWLESTVANSGIFAPQSSGGLYGSTIKKCLLVASTDTSFIYQQNNGQSFIHNTIQDVEMQRTATSTVVPFSIITTAGAANFNQLNQVRFNGLNNVTTPFMHVESTLASTYLTDWTLINILGEQNPGGLIRVLGAFNWTVINVTDEDSTVDYVANIIDFQSNGLGLSPRDLTFIGCQRHGRQMTSGKYEISAPTARNVTVINADPTPTSQTAQLNLPKSATVLGTQGYPQAYQGTGTPEGALSAVVGSQYMRLDGGAGSSFYVKESGTGNTGWIGK